MPSPPPPLPEPPERFGKQEQKDQRSKARVDHTASSDTWQPATSFLPVIDSVTRRFLLCDHGLFSLSPAVSSCLRSTLIRQGKKFRKRTWDLLVFIVCVVVTRQTFETPSSADSSKGAVTPTVSEEAWTRATSRLYLLLLESLRWPPGTLPTLRRRRPRRRRLHLLRMRPPAAT